MTQRIQFPCSNINQVYIMGLYQQTVAKESRLKALEQIVSNAGLNPDAAIKEGPDALKARRGLIRESTATATTATTSKPESTPAAPAPRKSILDTAKPRGRFQCVTVNGDGTTAKKSWEPQPKPASRFALVPA